MESTLSIISNLLYIAIVASMIIFWIISFADVLESKFKGGEGTQVIWLLTVFFLQIIGAILYHFIGKKQKVFTKHKDNLATS
jgi:hypothetical protein